MIQNYNGIITFVFILMATGFSAENNLVFNSSFELGENGWSGCSKKNVVDNQYCDVHPTWEVVDCESKFGKKAFMMQNIDPSAESTILHSHDFLVKPNQKYTVSFWAKATNAEIRLSHSVISNQRMLFRNASGQPLPDTDFSHCSKDKPDTRGKGTVAVSTSWGRYSFSFIPEKWYTAYVLSLKLSTDKSPVLIDGVQIEEGELTDYAPMSVIEAAVNTSNYLYEKQCKIDGTVKVISYDGNKELDLPIILFDAYNEKKIQEKSITFGVEKDLVAEKPFMFSAIPYGWFCIYTGLQPRITPKNFRIDWSKQPENLAYERLQYGDMSYQSAAYFVSVPTPSQRTENGFKLGMNGNLDNAGYSKKAFTVNGRTDEVMRMLRLSGTKVLRCWDYSLCPWGYMSSEKGKYLWEGIDKRIEAAESIDLDLICVLGGVLANTEPDRGYVPDWAKARDRSGNCEGSLCPANTQFGRKGRRYYKPQLEDWKEYISAVVTRYKGRIKYYEIINEADIYMPAETYMEYAKSASEEIRKADPKAIILGICSTADRTLDPNANTETSIGKCIDLGVDNYIDHITIHPYGMLDNSAGKNQVNERRNHFAYLKKKEVNAGLWDGENYFLIPDWMPHSSFGNRWKPEDLARYLIVDMGEGLVGSTPLHYSGLVSYYGLHPFIISGYTYRKYPNAKFAAQAACSKFIGGATPIYALSLNTGALGYVFKNENRLLSSVWNSRSAQKTELTFIVPKKSTVTIYDIMGNIIEETSGTIKLPLSATPYYMEWKGTDAETVRNCLQEGSILCEYPIQVKRAHVLNTGFGSELMLDIQNTTGSDIIHGNLTVESAAFKFPVIFEISRLKDFSSTILSSPVSLVANDKENIQIKAVSDFGLPKIVKTVAQVRNAEEISSLAKSFKINKCVFGEIPDENDMSAQFSISFENRDRAIILDVHVKDDKQGEMSKIPWEQDSLELFIDNDPMSDSGSVSHIFIPLISGSFNKERVSALTEKTYDGYHSLISIPIGYTKYIGFDIAVDDSDDNRRTSQLVWRGTSNNYINRNALPVLNIIDSIAARIDVISKNKDGERIQYRYGKNDNASNQWMKYSFSFTPSETGKADLHLRSGWAKDGENRCWVDYRNIKVTGATLDNEDFSKLDSNGNLMNWRFFKRAELIKNGDSRFIRATHDEFAIATFNLEAGKPIIISYEVRAGDLVK